MRILSDLQTYYEENGIEALNFTCKHRDHCSAGCPDFTGPKAAFVGEEYERGTLPRVLFVSLDSGDASPNPRDRTLRRVREIEQGRDVLALDRKLHWYNTHEIGWRILQRFAPWLQLKDITPYFAHTNSAKCCMNRSGKKQAADRLFGNCRVYVPEELKILKPEIVVTQGKMARTALRGIDVLRRGEKACASAETFEYKVLSIAGKPVLCMHTYHPSAYGHFWRQKKNCLETFADLASAFIREREKSS